jgi:hypothetical protein
MDKIKEDILKLYYELLKDSLIYGVNAYERIITKENKVCFKRIDPMKLKKIYKGTYKDEK